MFSDGTTRDLTGQATWSSDHPEIESTALLVRDGQLAAAAASVCDTLE